MESNIRIREYEDNDKGKVFSLLASFYDNIKTEQDWEHLYRDNPDGKAIISVAGVPSTGEIIGHYSVIKMTVDVFGRSYLGGKGEGEIFDFAAVKNLLSKGNALNRSLSTDLLRHTLDTAVAEGITFVCTNPSDLALKSHLDASFKALKQDFDIFIYPLKPAYISHLFSKITKIKILSGIISYFLAGIFKVLLGANKYIYRGSGIVLEPFETFSDTTDALMDGFRESQCITIDRRQGHLNWRFNTRDYKKYAIRFEGRQIGYIVIHFFVNPNGFKEANLADYLILPRYWDKFGAIIINALKKSTEEGSDLLRINYMYDIKERFGLSKILKSLFFVRRKDKRNIVLFISAALKPLEEKMFDIKNWFFTDLYFENY